MFSHSRLNRESGGRPRPTGRPLVGPLQGFVIVALLAVAGGLFGSSTSSNAAVTGPAAVAAANLAAFVGALPPSTQFDVTGFLQVATLDSTCVASAHCGGSLQVNGQFVTVPKETIVILPANALTWQELFAQAPAPYGLGAVPPSTGMAMVDVPTPLATYEVHVVGNRVADVYIAGLIDIAQQGLNSGAGYINFMNYATGEMRVGGIMNSATTGTRVRLNDPTGRYGRVMTPDQRFTVDADNPTIAAATGFPMCFPRVDPTSVNPDALCPEGNRPGDGTGNPSINIQMNDPAALPGVFPDATKQAPFEVGDYVTFSGTLVTDAATPTVGPFPGTASTYVSAHTIINNAAIYTWPGTNPAYVSTEVALIGTGGLTVIGAGEAVIRTRFEGMTTDPSRNIHLWGMDVDPSTGAVTDRDWGTVAVDQGAPVGAVKGRWRFRPPCTAVASTATKLGTVSDKACSPPPAGTFLPPTREVRAVIEKPANGAGLAAVPAWIPGQTTAYANGIIAGQYHAPILEYIFPENLPGTPVVPNNFEAVAFLACGGYTSAAGTLVGQLNPWPGSVAPNCLSAPVANAGGPYTVASGGTVSLAGSAKGSTPLTYAWTAPAQGTLSALNIPNPVYTAPVVGAQTSVALSLTVTNSVGSSSATSTVSVSPALAPTVNAIAPLAVDSGASGTFGVTGSDPNVPAATPLTFTVTQSGTPALTSLVVTQNGPTGANVSFTAPAGVLSPSDVTLTITATNTAGLSSAAVTTTVTINPAATGTAPVASAGGPYTVASGGTVTLAGSATGSTPLTYAWALPAVGTLSDPTVSNPVYTAPVVGAPTTVNLSLTVTNSSGTSTATSTITVSTALPPTVNAVAPISVFSGAPGSFLLSATDPSGLPVTFAVTQAGAPALVGLTVAPTGPTTATVTFTAPTLPIGQVTSSVVNLTITATNAVSVTSSVTTTVTTKPLSDAVSIVAGTVEYRTGKQRLIMSATSSVISPNVILTLQPYKTESGTMFDPASIGATFTNGGNGLYTITLVGAPPPACNGGGAYAAPCSQTPLTVKSNLGGISAPHGLDRIRN